MEITGRMVAIIRKHMGMNQTEFARFLKVSRVTVSNWERKKDNPIPLEAARLIKDVCREAIDDFRKSANDKSGGGDLSRIRTVVEKALLALVSKEYDLATTALVEARLFIKQQMETNK